MEALSPGAEPSGLKGETRIQELNRAQRTIVRRTAESRATVPDLELGLEVDIEAALAVAQERGLALTAFLVRAVALALREHPSVNGAYRDGRFELYSRINVGVVIHVPDGYVTPTVLDADTKSLEQLTEELEVLGPRARGGQLTPPELAGATFTLSDLSDLGIDRWNALVVRPQAGAITAGAVRSVPVLREGAIMAGRRINLTLACDHRILFGARAAAFLRHAAQRLERAQL